jgi:hypothetical protein
VIAKKGYFTKEIGGNVNDSMHHPHSLECIRELVGKVHKRSSWWQEGDHVGASDAGSRSPGLNLGPTFL